ncbi:MAG: TetR family transcriptional regulator [Armatimonadota bacterium]|nr:TetR family transcriptional regulator [Armatimonadota bacterium]
MKKTKDIRTRGAKPQDPDARAARVKTAVRDLQKIGAAFTVAEVAERAGISRATLYRCADLRALVGAKGDGPRTVDAAVHEKLEGKHAALKTKARDLRRRLADAEEGWEEMRERARTAEGKLAAAERRAETLAAHARGVGGSLGAVAIKLGPDEMRRARRVLARALHPDLFAQDAATAALATEMLKTLNALAE